MTTISVDYSTTSDISNIQTVSGSSSFTYNSLNKTLDITANTVQGVTRCNSISSPHLILEAQIKLSEDPSNRKHFGLWLSSVENNRAGIRFSHLDSYFTFSFWNTDTNESLNLPTVYEGDISKFDGKTVPSISLGSTCNMKMYVQGGLILGNIYYGHRIKAVCNDVILFDQVVHSSPTTSLYPGFFNYGNTTSVSYFIVSDSKYWGDSELPDTLTLNMPENNIPFFTENYLRGSSTISGTLMKKDIPLPNSAVSLLTNNYYYIRRTYTDSSGNFIFHNLDPSNKYILVSQDINQEYSPIIFKT